MPVTVTVNVGVDGYVDEPFAGVMVTVTSVALTVWPPESAPLLAL